MAESCHFALTDPKPPVLTDASTDDQKKEMKRWIKADNIALCYIMTSMSPTLQLQNEGIEPAAAVMLNLEELLGSKDHANRTELTRKIVGTKMAEGASVNEHVLGLMHCMNELDQLGGGLDADLKSELILQSLPKSFDSFRLNAVMQKKSWTLNVLHNELLAAEGIMGKKSAQALITSKASTSSSKDGKRKRNFKSKRGKKLRGGGGAKPLGNSDQPKGKCFKCNQKGHWKKDCVIPRIF